MLPTRRWFCCKGYFSHHVPLESDSKVSILGHHYLARRSVRFPHNRRFSVCFSRKFSPFSTLLTRLPRRPGALLAAAWASLLYLGVDGYTESCREIVGAAQKIANGIRKDFPELYILGNPLVSVIAFGSRTEGKGNGRGNVPVYEVGDRMDKLGWHRAFLSVLSSHLLVATSCRRTLADAIVRRR